MARGGGCMWSLSSLPEYKALNPTPSPWKTSNNLFATASFLTWLIKTLALTYIWAWTGGLFWLSGHVLYCQGKHKHSPELYNRGIDKEHRHRPSSSATRFFSISIPMKPTSVNARIRYCTSSLSQVILKTRPENRNMDNTTQLKPKIQARTLYQA